MSDATKAFDFSQFVPGFDFLKNLAKPAGSGVSAVPGMPSLSSWVAPTLSVEEVDKRITELKAVQYWLEQNGHALKATIQALEVQKMTLSTLRGMNVRMEDLANAFTRTATIVTTPPVPKPAPAPVAAPVAQVEEPEQAPEEDEVADNPEAAPVKAKAGKSSAASSAAAGVIDPLQWWGALTQQFQQIATTAMQDAAKLGAPPGGSGTSSAAKKGASDAGAAGATAQKAAKKPARKAAAKKKAVKAAVRRR